VAGISNGGLCDTAKKAGVGCNQFSVSLECGQAANELNALCISDGSVRYPADICKALGAGSHMVLCGSIFYGYKENNTEWWDDHKAVDEPEEIGFHKMKAYGMSSTAANNKFFGGLKEYRTSEGKEKWVDYKGSVSKLAKDIRGGLASCCTYVNCKNLENISKCCTFVRNR
jgi:GMP reductase